MPSYLRQPPAWFHSRILVGPGSFLRPAFADQHKITHVINCAFDEDSPSWFRTIHPTRYECLEAIDHITSDLYTWFPKFEETMKRFLREGNGTVYVHCQAGINRSASLAMLYVLKNFNVDPASLIQSVCKQRPCMFNNPTFRRQIEEFINGRVQSTKDTGILWNDSNNRNIGFSAQRDYPESKGFEDDARKHDG